MSKQFAISSTASIFAMAAFALLAPDSVQMHELRGGEATIASYEAEMPAIEMPLPDLVRIGR